MWPHARLVDGRGDGASPFTPVQVCFKHAISVPKTTHAIKDVYLYHRHVLTFARPPRIPPRHPRRLVRPRQGAVAWQIVPAFYAGFAHCIANTAYTALTFDKKAVLIVPFIATGYVNSPTTRRAGQDYFWHVSSPAATARRCNRHNWPCISPLDWARMIVPVSASE